jgi:hypothetical protein
MPADITISPSILSAGEALLLSERLQQPQHWPTLQLLLLLQPQIQHPQVSNTTGRDASTMHHTNHDIHTSVFGAFYS